jgi:hypothetical protein
LRFLAEPEFDAQEQWNVGVVLRRAGQEPAELVVQVEATPPGVGPWGLAVYGFPFVLFGGLWAIGLMRRWRNTPAPCGASDQAPHDGMSTHPGDSPDYYANGTDAKTARHPGESAASGRNAGGRA